MRRFRAILFDLGHTLIYFDRPWDEILPEANRALVGVLKQAVSKLDDTDFLQRFSARMNEYYNQRDTEFIEYTTTYVVQRVLDEMGISPISESIVRQAVDAMYAVSQAHWQPEDDALPTLQALKEQGYRLGLISNAADDHDVQVLIDKAGLRTFFEVILTSAAQGIRKPNPRLFHTALAALDHIQPEQAAMVGDTLGADILGARNAGMYSIWITRRADSAANRAHLDTIQPDAKISTLSELLNLFP